MFNVVPDTQGTVSHAIWTFFRNIYGSSITVVFCICDVHGYHMSAVPKNKRVYPVNGNGHEETNARQKTCEF